jgi:hypothetical protein
LLINNDEPEFGSNSLLLDLKDYSGHSLVRGSQKFFEELIIPAEKRFRFIAANTSLKNTSNVTKSLLDQVLIETLNVELPQCHDIKSKLLSRFLQVRVKFFAREERRKQMNIHGKKVNKTQKPSSSVLGSKTATMKVLVANM